MKIKGKVLGVSNHSGEDTEGLPYKCWQITIAGNGEAPSSIFREWIDIEIPEKESKWNTFS